MGEPKCDKDRCYDFYDESRLFCNLTEQALSACFLGVGSACEADWDCAQADIGAAICANKRCTCARYYRLSSIGICVKNTSLYADIMRLVTLTFFFTSQIAILFYIASITRYIKRLKIAMHAELRLLKNKMKELSTASRGLAESVRETSLSLRPQWESYKQDVFADEEAEDEEEEDKEYCPPENPPDFRSPVLRGGVLAMLTRDDILPDDVLRRKMRWRPRFSSSSDDEFMEMTEGYLLRPLGATLRARYGFESMYDSSDDDLCFEDETRDVDR